MHTTLSKVSGWFYAAILLSIILMSTFAAKLVKGQCSASTVASLATICTGQPSQLDVIRSGTIGSVTYHWAPASGLSAIDIQQKGFISKKFLWITMHRVFSMLRCYIGMLPRYLNLFKPAIGLIDIMKVKNFERNQKNSVVEFNQ